MISIVHDRLRPGFVLIIGSLIGISSGCGGSNTTVITEPKDKAERVAETSLTQLGDVLRLRQEDSATPPATMADVTKYEKAYPLSLGKLKKGQLVLFYDVPLQDGIDDMILAYEKEAPESGGHVLMQDGKTIKKMTSDEFKAAKKAGKGS
jgi:hypothetical protein